MTKPTFLYHYANILSVANSISVMLTTIACDVMARYKRLRGYDVYYLTGTDEHGQKIEQKQMGWELRPKHIDDMAQNIKNCKSLDITYDQFIRTTSDKHKACSVYF